MSEDEKPRDLRFTSREDQGVRIDRDLSGGGHLARGSKTNMSNLKFSVQAKPRDYLDPELQALRPEAPATPAPVAVNYPVDAGAPVAPAVAPAQAPLSPEAPPTTGGFFGALKRLFS